MEPVVWAVPDAAWSSPPSRADQTAPTYVSPSATGINAPCSTPSSSAPLSPRNTMAALAALASAAAETPEMKSQQQQQHPQPHPQQLQLQPQFANGQPPLQLQQPQFEPTAQQQQFQSPPEPAKGLHQGHVSTMTATGTTTTTLLPPPQPQFCGLPLTPKTPVEAPSPGKQAVLTLLRMTGSKRAPATRTPLTRHQASPLKAETTASGGKARRVRRKRIFKDFEAEFEQDSEDEGGESVFKRQSSGAAKRSSSAANNRSHGSDSDDDYRAPSDDDEDFNPHGSSGTKRPRKRNPLRDLTLPNSHVVAGSIALQDEALYEELAKLNRNEFATWLQGQTDMDARQKQKCKVERRRLMNRYYQRNSRNRRGSTGAKKSSRRKSTGSAASSGGPAMPEQDMLLDDDEQVFA